MVAAVTSTPALSIVIPAYNEAARLPHTLGRVLAWAGRTADPVEIIVVDDGSSDDTPEIARALSPPVALIQLGRNSGKGAAVRAGVLASHGAAVLVTDADLSAPIEEFESLRAAIAAGSAVALGSRSARGAQVQRPQPVHRRILGRVFNAIVQFLVLPGVQDTQCGFKLFEGRAARAIFARTRIDGFAFDVEALVIARRLGLRVVEVPVEWWDSPRSRVRLRDPLIMLVELLRIRLAATSIAPEGRRRLAVAKRSLGGR